MVACWSMFRLTVRASGSRDFELSCGAICHGRHQFHDGRIVACRDCRSSSTPPGRGGQGELLDDEIVQAQKRQRLRRELQEEISELAQLQIENHRKEQCRQAIDEDRLSGPPLGKEGGSLQACGKGRAFWTRSSGASSCGSSRTSLGCQASFGSEIVAAHGPNFSRWAPTSSSSVTVLMGTRSMPVQSSRELSRFLQVSERAFCFGTEFS